MRLHCEYLPATVAAQQELVLLHGWGCNRDVWRPLLASLRPWANLTLLDVPGAAPGSQASTALALADVLRQLLQHCPPRAVVVGWSLGGQLAVALAAVAPERVSAVVTLCSSPRFIALRHTAGQMPYSPGVHRHDADAGKPSSDAPDIEWLGMDAVVFAQFRAQVAADPEAAVQRFDSLMVAGSRQSRALLRQLRALRRWREMRTPPVPNQQRAGRSDEVLSKVIGAPLRARASTPAAATPLLAGLDWLAQLDQRAQYRSLAHPRLHLFAQQDALVPAQVAAWVGAHSSSQPGVEVAVLPDCSHLLPLEAPQELACTLHRFLVDARLLWAAPTAAPELQKSAVAASFSRAAKQYDSVAHLQRDVGEYLLAYLPVQPSRAEGAALLPDRAGETAERPLPTPGPAAPPGLWTSTAAVRTVLDLGCGTGYFRAALTAHFPQAHYVGLDLAEGMVKFARGADARDCEAWLVADAEALPLADASVDLVFSSLALQWCARLEHVFAELARVLRPGGVCVFTSLGPQTLRELREAWAAVDTHQHVNTFAPEWALTRAAERVPEIKLTLQSRAFHLQYRRVRDLLDELKVLGAHNMNRDRPAGLTSRRALQTMLAAYEAQRVDGLLPATYDVIFGVLEKA